MFISGHEVCGKLCSHNHKLPEDQTVRLRCYRESRHPGPCYCSQCPESSSIVGYAEGYNAYMATLQLAQDMLVTRSQLTEAEQQSARNREQINQMGHESTNILAALQNLTPEQVQLLRNRGEQRS